MADGKKHTRLSDIPRRDPFKTPEGYYDNLEQRIHARIDQRPEARVFGLRVSLVKYATLGIAASIAAILIFLPGRQSDTSSPTAAELISKISGEECLAYLQHSDVAIEDLLSISEPELWNEAMEDTASPMQLSEEGEELLYEQFGVSDDENLQML